MNFGLARQQILAAAAAAAAAHTSVVDGWMDGGRWHTSVSDFEGECGRHGQVRLGFVLGFSCIACVRSSDLHRRCLMGLLSHRLFTLPRTGWGCSREDLILLSYIDGGFPLSPPPRLVAGRIGWCGLLPGWSRHILRWVVDLDIF
jgi:hypothetical protein